jgi:hypothetical protein
VACFIKILFPDKDNWLWLDKQLWLIVLNFNSSFQSAAAVGKRITNATPAQSLIRKR